MNLEGKYVLTEGVVLDHLLPLTAPRVLKELELGQVAAALVMAVRSKHRGRKDMLFLPPVEISRQALLRATVLCPELTLSTVRESKIENKDNPRLEWPLQGVLRCPNSGCISHVEETTHRVELQMDRLDSQPYRCFYCEHQYSHEDLEFLS